MTPKVDKQASRRVADATRPGGSLFVDGGQTRRELTIPRSFS
jgi:hypothetical protein